MEEDIELQSVDKIINDIERCGYIDAHLGRYDDYQVDSILHYLKQYKQLEEENNSKQKAYDNCYCEYKHYKQFDSIPKLKVIEKIKELEDGTYDAKIILQQLLKD